MTQPITDLAATEHIAQQGKTLRLNGVHLTSQAKAHVR